MLKEDNALKICIVSFTTLNTDGTDATRILKEIKSLACAGHKVKAVGLKIDDKSPSSEMYHGVEINRVKPLIGFDRVLQRKLPKQNLASNINRLFTLVIKNTLASMFVLSKVVKKDEADIYHCFGIYSLLPGLLIKIIRGKKVVYDAVEPVPQKVETITSLGSFAKPLAKIIGSMECFISSHFDNVFITPSAKNEYLKRFKRFNSNSIVLRNTPPLEWSNSKNLKLDRCGHNRVLIYIGALTKHKGIMEILEVFKTIHSEFPNTKLVLVGSLKEYKSFDNLSEEVMDFIQKNNLEEDIIITGHINWQEIPRYLETADVALHIYKPLPGLVENEGSSSLFEYMSASVPVIASNFPAYQFIEEYNCGKLVDPTNLDEVKECVRYVISNPKEAKKLGLNARKVFEKRYNWSLEGEKLLSAYSTFNN